MSLPTGVSQRASGVSRFLGLRSLAVKCLDFKCFRAIRRGRVASAIPPVRRGSTDEVGRLRSEAIGEAFDSSAPPCSTARSCLVTGSRAQPQSERSLHKLSGDDRRVDLPKLVDDLRPFAGIDWFVQLSEQFFHLHSPLSSPFEVPRILSRHLLWVPFSFGSLNLFTLCGTILAWATLSVKVGPASSFIGRNSHSRNVVS